MSSGGTSTRQLRRRGARASAGLRRAYDAHGEAVASYAYHVTGDRGEAERLAIGVFQAAHRQLADGRRLGPVRVWLLREVRRRAPILPRDRRGGVRLLPEVGGRELTALRAQLWRLPLDQQDALVLRHWCGLRPRAIARVVGAPAGDVRLALGAAETAVGGVPPRRRGRRRLAGTVAGTAALVGAQVRGGTTSALASTVPGFAGSAAAGGSSAAVTGLAVKLVVGTALAVTAAGAGA